MFVGSARFIRRVQPWPTSSRPRGGVRSSSPTWADRVARHLPVEAWPSQAESVIPDPLAHADPVVERFADGAQIGCADGVSMRALLRRKLGRGVKAPRSGA